MPRNIEIKAKVDDTDKLRRIIEQMADRGPESIHQEDVFFRSSEGRLKLRRFSGGAGELIFYQRPDGKAPSESRYFRSPTTDPGSLTEVLSMSLGVRGVVKKTRMLYWSGQTRIHLDEVDGLGSFMELEVVLQPHQTTMEGTRIAHHIMETLKIEENALVDVAYIDLLEQAANVGIQEIKKSGNQE